MLRERRLECTSRRCPGPALEPERGTELYVQREARKPMGSVIKKRRKRMSKKKHRKMLRRTRVQRRKLGK